MAFAIDEELDRKNKASPLVLDTEPEAAPVDPPLVDAKPMPKQSLVAQYLASKRSPATPDVDPALEQAQTTDRTNAMIGGISSALSNVGNQAARGAQSFANAIGGHGYSSGGQEVAPDTAPKAPSAVKTYLEAKAAKSKAAETDAGTLKDLATADKDEAATTSLSDPTGLRAREVAVKELENKRKGTKDEVVGKQKDRSLDQGDEKLGLTDEHQNETKRHNGETEDIARQRISLTRQMKYATNEATREKIALQLKKLGLSVAKFDKSNAAGVTEGVTYDHVENVPAKSAAANSSSAEFTDKVHDTIARIKELQDPNSGYASLPLTEKRMKIESLFASIRPDLVKTANMGNFTVGHDHVTREMIATPGYLSGLNPEAVNGLLDQIGDVADSNLAAQVKHTPGSAGRVNKKGEKQQQAPKYNADAGKVEQPVDTTPVTVRRKSDGKTITLAGDRAEKYLADPGFEVAK